MAIFRIPSGTRVRASRAKPRAKMTKSVTQVLVDWSARVLIYGSAAIIIAGYVLLSAEPNHLKQTTPHEDNPLTPFHHDLAQAGRWDISKEVAALIPETFDEAVQFVGASASPRSVLPIRGVYPLGPEAEDIATGENAGGIRALRSQASRDFPGRDVTRGTAFTVRLRGTETATFDSMVVIYLWEPAGGGVLVSARRRDGVGFYPL